MKKFNSFDDINLSTHSSGPCYGNRSVAVAASLVILIASKQKKNKQIRRKRKRQKKQRHHPQTSHVFEECRTFIPSTAATTPLIHKDQSALPCPNSIEVENLWKDISLKDAEMYRQCLRMDIASFYELHSLIKPLVQKKDTVMKESIAATERLAITLRYLALGETQKTLASEFKIAQNTISGIIPDVCQALCTVLAKFLKTPTTTEEWKAIAHGFDRNWGFPWCIGALDGKSVKLSSSSSSHSKGKKVKSNAIETGSPVHLVTLVNANFKFIFADVGFHNQLHKEEEWEQSSLATLVEKNSLNIPSPVSFPGSQKFIPFVFLASHSFPLRSYIMKPYLTPGNFLDDAKRLFNYKASRPLRVSDNAYGILTTRFLIYRQPIRAILEKGRQIIIATICLHNFLMSGSSRYGYCPPGLADTEDPASGMFYPGQWRAGDASTPGAMTSIQGESESNAVYAEEVRNTFCHYFYSNPQLTTATS